MYENTTISVALLISVASIVFTALNYRRNAKKMMKNIKGKKRSK